LLTALVQCLSPWAGSGRLLVDLEGHGREETIPAVDLTRTVGWFTSIYPLLLDLERAGSTDDALNSVMHELRKIPNKGIGYGLLRYLRGDRIKEKLQAFPQAEVSFNYMGRFGQSAVDPLLFTEAPETLRRIRSSKTKRPYLLGINVYVAWDSLRVDWTYCELMYRRGAMEALTDAFIEAVRSVMTHCLSIEHSGHGASDFPRSQLDPMSLENVYGQAEFE
jgi:non-ribosomal peptide synthase protein (TIGR01720 family)